MAVIKCKMCGGDLEILADSSVCECEYCGTRQTVPKVDDEKKLKLFERANRLRAACEFDKAAGVYETILADFDQEAEAYWGLILCKFGIEYVDDPATKKKIPTCHRSSFDSLMDDPNFELVMEYADPIARRVYREEAKAIEELRKSILEVSSREEPYDVFISYKELDENGERTLDSVIAQDIYTELTDRGCRVFFSRISLEDKLGVEYEPYIFAALHSAKVMLAVGTDYDYFNAVWVKNEWSRFLALIAKGEKKMLIPVFKGIDAYDMPKEFNKLAAQDMGKLGAMQDLVRGVEKLVGKKKTEPAAQPVVPSQLTVVDSRCEAAVKRGCLALEDGEWENADRFFEDALSYEAENARAYFGKLLARRRLHRGEELIAQDEPFAPDRDYQKALRFGDEAFRRELQSYEKGREDRLVRLAEEEAERQRELAERQARKNAEAERRKERLRAVLPKTRDFLSAYLSAADWHTVGLRSDGTVVATQYTGDPKRYGGQCEVGGWTDIVAIAAGDSHTVGLRSDGTVVATKYTGDPEYYHGQCEVDGWTDIVAIAAGDDHTVGLKSDGTVIATEYTGDPEAYCGQCKVGGWKGIIAIAAGGGHTVGLKSDGTVIATEFAGKGTAWYIYDSGQCEVGDWTDIVAIAAGCDHTVGLKSDGTVVATQYTGDPEDYEGQCEVGGWTDIVAIAAGYMHTVGLRSDGTVIATKYTGAPEEYEGQCEVGGWTDIVAIAAETWHTVGLKSDGTVVATQYTGDPEYYVGECEVGGWKLFDDFEPVARKAQARIEPMRIAVTKRAEAERRAAAERAEAERKAAAEQAESERRAAVERAEVERKALSREKASLQAELLNLKGLFSGKRRREIEARLAQIDTNLKKLG